MVVIAAQTLRDHEKRGSLSTSRDFRFADQIDSS